MYLETIDSPSDLKGLTVRELEALAEEVRAALIARAAHHGGHLGSNLGVVELTVAVHYVFDSPRDRVVFDVSHQTYAHKMLTGRREAFCDPAHYDDVSGFSSPEESPHDPFVLGHTSTSVSLAAGLARARDLSGGTENVVAVIGDGSLSGGEAFEGLDLAGELGGNLIVVVNDNEMSIAENHGALYENLALLRKTRGAAADNFFRTLGFGYRYVEDGNSVAAVVEALEAVKDSPTPQVVHVHTSKGCGFAPAERDRERFHNVGPVDLSSGEELSRPDAPAWRDVTSDRLLAKMAADPDVVTVCAGTPTGLGFTADKRALAGPRFVDVGIAEATAATFSVGLAAAGKKPVLCIYSTFLGRAYDQLAQELCINGEHVVVVVDRGSVFGMTDATHLGLSDIPMLGNIAGLTYLAPATVPEYLAMLDWAVDRAGSPVAVKVPGGAPVWEELPDLQEGSRAAIVGAGTFLPCALEAARIVEGRSGVRPTVVNPKVVSEVSPDLLGLLEGHEVVVTLEDGVAEGGFGQKVACALADGPAKVLVRGFAKEVVDRYDPATLVEGARMTPELVAQDVLDALGL